MMKNRREFIKASIAAPCAALAIPIAEVDKMPVNQLEYTTVQHIATLPVTSGKIVGMIQYRDKVYVATEYGGIYELSPWIY